MEVDRNGLEVLDRHECLRLLSSTTLGRIGFTSGALPTVLPVNFNLEGDRILVRTAKGSKLDAALRDVVVAFEIDEFDPVCYSGWSVAVTGMATAASNAAELGAARHEPVAHWAPSADEAVIAISTEFMTGRRITTGSSVTRG